MTTAASHSTRGERTAELTGAKHVVLQGSGHIPNGRRPVKINELISEFAGDGKPSWPVVRRRKGKRALLVSSPIGLGHAWRDVAIARELRRQVPGLEVEWLAQPPLNVHVAHRLRRYGGATRDVPARSLSLALRSKDLASLSLCRRAIRRRVSGDEPHEVLVASPLAFRSDPRGVGLASP